MSSSGYIAQRRLRIMKLSISFSAKSSFHLAYVILPPFASFQRPTIPASHTNTHTDLICEFIIYLWTNMFDLDSVSLWRAVFQPSEVNRTTAAQFKTSNEPIIQPASQPAERIGIVRHIWWGSTIYLFCMLIHIDIVMAELASWWEPWEWKGKEEMEKTYFYELNNMSLSWYVTDSPFYLSYQQ